MLPLTVTCVAVVKSKLTTLTKQVFQPFICGERRLEQLGEVFLTAPLPNLHYLESSPMEKHGQAHAAVMVVVMWHHMRNVRKRSAGEKKAAGRGNIEEVLDCQVRIIEVLQSLTQNAEIHASGARCQL